MLEVTPAITRAAKARTPGGSEVVLSPERQAKVQALHDKMVQEDLEEAEAEAARAAAVAAELAALAELIPASASDDDDPPKKTSFEADADLDPDLVSTLSEVFKGVGEAQGAATQLTARRVTVRQIAEAENPRSTYRSLSPRAGSRSRDRRPS